MARVEPKGLGLSLQLAGLGNKGSSLSKSFSFRALRMHFPGSCPVLKLLGTQELRTTRRGEGRKCFADANADENMEEQE